MHTHARALLVVLHNLRGMQCDSSDSYFFFFAECRRYIYGCICVWRLWDVLFLNSRRVGRKYDGVAHFGTVVNKITLTFMARSRTFLFLDALVIVYVQSNVNCFDQ